MIPHRMLHTEICGNGLKDRVTACRKRLRVNRVAQRSQVNNYAEELFPETTPTASRLQEYAAGSHPVSGVMPPVVRLDYHAPFAVPEPEESETLQLIGEQEVGIT